MNDEHLEKLLREIDEEDDYAWLKETNAELREKIGILFNKNKQLETDNAEINEKLDSKRKTIKSLCEELDSLRIVSIEIERLRIENKHLQESRPQSELDAAHLAAENAMLNINFARYISATQDTEKENERLASMVRELQDENAALREKAERYRLVTLKQDADNTALCNKLAALENQTQWECSCGGTDCKGQKENAALREDNLKAHQMACAAGLERDRLRDELAALRERVHVADSEIDQWASRCAAAIWMLPETVTGGQLREAQNKFHQMLHAARAKEDKP